MTNYEKLQTLLIKEGMDKKWSKMFVKKLSDDEKAFSTDEKTKEWALKRGFYPGRVEQYGLNDENYKSYLPDYSYFMIHPINHHFKIWVNDKLTLKYVLNSCGCEVTMPDYYLYVENNGNYSYLMDAPSHIARDSNFILNLLKEKGTLAIKPNSGTSGGRGFMKVKLESDNIYVNNKIITKDEFTDILSNLQNHIVTEYAYQHNEISKIWSESECTLRVIMVKIPPRDNFSPSTWKNIVSYARFGTSISGGASNLSSGGIGIGFDFETGQFNDFGIRYKRFCENEQWVCYEHPDTKVKWSDKKLPNWNFVKNKILQVCNHITSLDYLGFDVIITPNGLNFCEINTHPAADYEQVMCGPILKDNENILFFQNKKLFDFDTERFYELYQESQFK